MERRQGQGLLIARAVNLACVLAVDIDNGKIMNIGSKRGLACDSGDVGLVNHRAPAHVHILKSERRCAVCHAIHTCAKLPVVTKLKLRDGDERHRRLRDGRKRLAAIIFEHSLTQNEELGRSLSLLIYGGVIVIACHVGLEAWRIGSRPMAVTCATVSHIEGETDAPVEHCVNASHHVVSWAGLMTCAPLVKPPAPELAAHLGRGGAEP